MTIKEFTDIYTKLAFTHNYMFGYAEKGVVYCTIATAEVLPEVCILDAASRDQGAALRFKPNKTQREILKRYETFKVCALEVLENLYETTKYNRGEIFEKLITEKFGQTWTKDHVPFTVAGDIEVDGVAYQVKYNKATFTNEKTLANLMRATA